MMSLRSSFTRAALAATAAFAAVLSLPAQAGPDVSVSVGIHQPGVYGRIEIGNRPPPVILPQPVVIAPGPVAVYQQPVYLYVPPGHQKHWAKHCARYAACGQPVYFVQERWVVERYRERHPGYRHESRHESRYRDESRFRGDDTRHWGNRGDRGDRRHELRRDDRGPGRHVSQDRHDGHPGKGHGRHKD